MSPTELVNMLDLEPIEPGVYQGRNTQSPRGVIFGGQLLAQSLAAAALSNPEMQVKSMHTMFLRGGRLDESLVLEAERLHVGRTFGSVEVSARQGDRLCTRSLVLLHKPDPDFISHHDQAPELSPPVGDPVSDTALRGWDVRIQQDADISDPQALGPPDLCVWSRFTDVPSEPWISQALLAYASDGFLIGTAMRPHEGVGQALAHVSIDTSVITQTLTFHQQFNAGNWLLAAHHSPHAGQGRSFGRADVFAQNGDLVASYSQENMIRAMATK
jgi:acyl-CoA thioesterase II